MKLKMGMCATSISQFKIKNQILKLFLNFEL